MANTTHESLAAKAAAYLRDSAKAVDGFCGIQSEIDRQAECLLQWAREHRALLTDLYTEGLEKYNRDTMEHAVFFGSPDRRVIKCTKPGRFGLGHGPKGYYHRHPAATPLFYLQRLELMNQNFLTDLRMEGLALGRHEFGNEGELRPYVITSQRYVEIADEDNPHPTEREVEDFMLALRFNLIPGSCFNWFRESDGLIVTDTKQPNFIISHEGIVPIDLIISKELR